MKITICTEVIMKDNCGCDFKKLASDIDENITQFIENNEQTHTSECKVSSYIRRSEYECDKQDKGEIKWQD